MLRRVPHRLRTGAVAVAKYGPFLTSKGSVPWRHVSPPLQLAPVTKRARRDYTVAVLRRLNSKSLHHPSEHPGSALRQNRQSLNDIGDAADGIDPLSGR